MKPTELLAFLQEIYREREAMLLRHIAVSRHVGDLDFNNTYQYVVAREETHLRWLYDAIVELGGTPPAAGPEPRLEPPGRDGWRDLVRDDARTAQAFVDTWRPRVEEMQHARNRTMLRILLGEVVEHQRFFEQAAAGRDDLLGRRMDAGARRGQVIASRWVGD